MKIKTEDLRKIKEILARYSEIHGEIDSLESELAIVLAKKAVIFTELTTLREMEKSIINKIEADNESSVSSDALMKIINSQANV